MRPSGSAHGVLWYSLLLVSVRMFELSVRASGDGHIELGAVGVGLATRVVRIAAEIGMPTAVGSQLVLFDASCGVGFLT